MNHDELLSKIRLERKAGGALVTRRELQEALNARPSAMFLEKLGHLLKGVPSERILSDVNPSSWKNIRTALVSNFNCDPINNILRGLLAGEEIALECHIGDYNQFIPQLMDAASELYQSAPDVVLCLLDDHYVFDGVADSWNVSQLSAVLEERVTVLEALIKAHVSHSRALLVLNTIPLSLDRYEAVVAYQSRCELSRLWREMNTRLLAAAAGNEQTIVLDSEVLLQKCHADCSDARLSIHASVNMSLDYLLPFAEEAVKLIRASLGKSKKCLVLDMDNSLWGGAIGEDGVNGISLGPDVTGRAYEKFQQTAKALKEQGVLLAVNSKNDRRLALEAFNHPHMVLREEDFVKTMINWMPKSENLREIASSVNIGVDSFVFFDDEPFERELVRQQVPEAALVNVPRDPSYYVRTLLDKGWFTTISLTNEDRQRTATYRQQVQRNDLMKSTGSMEDYLHGLGIEIAFVKPDDFNLPRLSQLNARTNQFNMTTRRFSTAAMQEMVNSDCFGIYGVQAKDTFGDYGLVGSLIVEKTPSEYGSRWHIRNFLMSCRVLARGIEISTLRHVLSEAKRGGATEVCADYIRTDKNAKYESFYPDQGFTKHVEEGETVVFLHDLEKAEGQIPWITVKQD